MRRDFTINAIYADIEGKIFDPQNGMFDLKNGKVKFIGSSEERIQEDYLRILRYFRFFIQYSKNEHDQKCYSISKKNINGLNKISNERIFDEVKKNFINKKIYVIYFQINTPKKLFCNIFPQFKFHERLKIFNSLNKTLKENYDYKIILALLIIDKSIIMNIFCHKYKTSNSTLKNYLKIFQKILKV